MRLRVLPYYAILACGMLLTLFLTLTGNGNYVLFSLLPGGWIPTGNSLQLQQTRPSECNGCFEHNFRYILNEAEVCNGMNGKDPTSVIIVITSSPENQKERQLIRRTWGAYSKNNTAPNLRRVFLLGSHRTLDQDIKAESRVHRDIIQEDFMDSYDNLTLKTVMGLKWVTSHCKRARFLLKTDDDMMINVPNLLRTLRVENLTGTIAGDCLAAAKPSRNPSSKWRVSYELYPYNTYPGFCSGTGYVLPTSVAADLYKSSKNIPFFPLEDIYLAFNIARRGYRYKNLHEFHRQRTFNNPFYMCNCVVTAHEFSYSERLQIWRETSNGTCDRFLKENPKHYCHHFVRGFYIGLAIAIIAVLLILTFLCGLIVSFYQSRRVVPIKLLNS